MNKELIKRIRTAAIAECMRKGINGHADIRKALRHASESIQPMTVAGVKAAQTKGQDVCHIVS
jgi:uncharacterized protein with PhoU and TrkA domain